MRDKIALVVGGSGGIGAAIAEQMAKRGAKVYSSYHEREIVKPYTSIDSLQLDIVDGKSVQSALAKILERQKIDVVVFAVTAMIENKQLLTSQWADYAEHIDVQVKGLFNVVTALKDQIRSKYGTKFIIILTEYCFGKPPESLSHYVTAKYALMGFAKSMIAELAKYNCTINLISPGMTDTKLISNLPPKLIEITAERNPLGRIAAPLDIAKLAVFLASDESNYINGVNILVNGGNIVQ